MNTLLNFAKKECCNFALDECLGVDVFGKRFRDQGVCCIEEEKPCKFFFKCVLPLAKKIGLDNVLLQYQEIESGSNLKAKARVCKCGAELPKGRRFCEKCRKIRRRETKREYQRNYRG